MDNDLRELRDNIDDDRIIEILYSLGADRHITTSEYIIFPTICHNVSADEASMKLYYYRNTKLFHCYSGCDETFDIYELFEKRYDLLKKDYDFYKDILLKIDENYKNVMLTDFSDIPYESIKDKYKRKQNTFKLKYYNPNVLNVFNKFYTPEWLNDGITKETMDKFNILYSINQNKIVIPHYDIKGGLVGIRGRSLNQEDIVIGKYMPIKIEHTIYSHPLSWNLYGINYNVAAIRESGFAIVYESEKSVLLSENVFGNNTVAVCGSQFNRHQLDILLSVGAKEIILAFDKEFQNHQEKEKYFMKLYNKVKKFKNYCRMSFVIDNENLVDYKDSPIDKGSENLMKMLSKRVKVEW